MIYFEKRFNLYLDENIFNDDLKNRIRFFTVLLRHDKEKTSVLQKNTEIFRNIFIIFTNLQYFNFASSEIYPKYISFEILSPILISSTILELHVSVSGFNDCLYLLDGRFDQLRTLYVNIASIRYSSDSKSKNTVK